MDHDEDIVFAWVVCGLFNLLILIGFRFLLVSEPISLLYYVLFFISGPAGSAALVILTLIWIFYLLSGIML